MGTTNIEWADYSFNPWWGCQKVSPGCLHCYAETTDHRLGGAHWGPSSPRKIMQEANWKQIGQWNNAARKTGSRLRVFIGSMCDIFEDRPELEIIRRRLFKEMAGARWLTHLLLTKRVENILPMVPASWKRGFPSHIWVGTSVERQDLADHRIPMLLQVPARRFLSCEPLLGPLDLTLYLPDLHWAIVGGESGSYGRPMHPEWVREIREQCEVAGVPFFFKQWGRYAPDCKGKNIPFVSSVHNGDSITMYSVGKAKAGRLLDGVSWSQVPKEMLHLKSTSNTTIDC